MLFPGSAKSIDEESGDIIENKDEDPDLLENRPPLQRGLVISGGVLANILLSFLICTGVAGEYTYVCVCVYESICICVCVRV